MSSRTRTRSVTSSIAKKGALCALLGVSVGAYANDLSGEDFDCLIEPKMSVLVGVPTQGVIDTLVVERTDFVEQGQVIATLRSDVEVAAMEHARVRATMKSDIQAREADLKLAEVNMRRINELIDKQLVSQQQRDEAQAQLEVARMAVRQARDNKRLYEQEYIRAKEIAEQRVIRSPISGVVVEVRAFPGEFVFQNPIVAIAQIDPLKVEAIVPARYFGAIQEGMLASIEPEIQAAGGLTGVVSRVDRLIDAPSGTFSVHLELPNAENRTPAGQRCSISFSDAVTNAN